MRTMQSFLNVVCSMPGLWFMECLQYDVLSFVAAGIFLDSAVDFSRHLFR